MSDKPIPLDAERRKRPPGQRGGKAGVRDALAAAEEVKPEHAGPVGGAAAEPANDRGSDRFEMKPWGLYFKTGDEKRPYRISGYFEPISETRDDEAQAWGLMLRFPDRDGAIQHVVIARDMFAGEGGELRSLLSRRGLYLNPSTPARQALNEYLANIATPRRARVVTRTGWHRIDGARVFVLPSRTFGDPPVEVIYQAGARDASAFGCNGTLDEWRNEVAALCVGNSRLLLAVSIALASPLLDLLGEDGGGLHLRGGSRVGKTTALRVAASVWGGEPGAGAAGYVRQWKATSNAVEGMAAAHSDALLPLDELGQADSKEVGDTAYMLANGMGKARSDRGGALRSPARFRVLFLSTGELSLADKIAEAGRQIQAGQQVRLIDVSADPGKGRGLFEDLHDTSGAEEFIQRLRRATARCYGTAAEAFISYILKRVSAEPEWPDELRRWLSDLVNAWLAECPDAGGQVRSVARRFALVAVAGELATMANVTGWTAGEAQAGITACFRDWLSARGSVVAHEDLQAVTRLRRFISLHGASRFEDWRDQQPDPAAQGAPDANPPPERFRTVNRAGWRRWVEDENSKRGWRYYLTADAMKEALGGMDRRQAHKVLIARGFLIPGSDGKAAASLTPPGHAKARLYQVPGSILGAEEEER